MGRNGIRRAMNGLKPHTLLNLDALVVVVVVVVRLASDPSSGTEGNKESKRE